MQNQSPLGSALPGQAPSEPLSSQAFKELLGSIYDGVVITDLLGKIINVNERMLSFVGQSIEEMRGQSILSVLSGNHSGLLEKIARALSDSRHVLISAYALRKSGNVFPVEISANQILLDEKCLCFFFRDITVRRRSEDLLRTGYNAISNCLSGIAVADPMGMIVYANQSAAKLWGCANGSELKGRKIVELWEDQTKAQHMMDLVMDSDQEWNGEMMANRLDGSKIALHVAAACNLDDDNEATGMVFSFVDMTDRLRADVAVREAQTREAMLASLAAACHHLGQPATVLLTSLDLLREQNAKTDEESVMLYKSAYEAALQLTDILKKLGNTSEYRTTNYLQKPDKESSFNKMLDIG